MQGYRVSIPGRRDINVLAQQPSSAVITVLHIALSIVVFNLVLAGPPTSAMAEEEATMVCKGGPEITFQTEFLMELNKIVVTHLTVHFRKGMGKTDSMGRNLNRGECGLLDRVFSSRHRSSVSAIVNDMKLKVHGGRITAKPTGRPWVDLTLSNQPVQFPVVIDKFGAIRSAK